MAREARPLDRARKRGGIWEVLVWVEAERKGGITLEEIVRSGFAGNLVSSA
jgi:hypothetical protein